MGFTYTILFILLYGYLYFNAARLPQKKLSDNASSIFIISHFIFISLFIFILVVGHYGWRFRGIRTNEIIILYAILSGILCLFFLHLNRLSLWKKIYFRIIGTFPFLLAGTLFIPFLGIVLVISLLGSLSPTDKIYYSDNEYRVQSTFGGALGTPDIDIYKKYFLLERPVGFRQEPAGSYIGPGEIDSCSRIDSMGKIFFLVYPDTGEVKYYLTIVNPE